MKSMTMFFTIALLIGLAGSVTANHELGIYADPEMTISQYPAAAPGYLTLYLGITWDENIDEEILSWNLTGFTGHIRTSGSIEILDWDFGTYHSYGELPDMLVEGGGIDFEDDYTQVIGQIFVELTGPEPGAIFLDPLEGDESMFLVTTRYPQYIYTSYDMIPSSGSNDLPVFAINGSVVANENMSWNGVKALFRN